MDGIKKIKIGQLLQDKGIMTLYGCDKKTDGDGVLDRFELEVPPFESASYFAANQKYDFLNPQKEALPDGTNRMQPFKIESFSNLKKGGLFLLLKLVSGEYLALLPMAHRQTIAWFRSEKESLHLEVGTLGTGGVQGDISILAAASDVNPYKACQDVWERAIEAVEGTTQLRKYKTYPEVFTYLGWCTWEEYRKDISEELLIKAVQRIEEAKLPIRFVLIDDGHLDVKDNMLMSFDTDSARFPNGWENITSLKRKNGIRWMGIWWNFNGYWGGTHPENRLGSLNEHFMKVKNGAMMPKNDFLSSVSFYQALVEASKKSGFDFIKVDNQAKNLLLYKGTEQPVTCAVNNSQALEEVSKTYMDGLINCMAHNTVQIFNTKDSAITRCSEDYKRTEDQARRHIYNSFGNIPFLGQTIWGDHDMFHSNDPCAGQMMSISKALSGGPVYLSDNPDEFIEENIWPLCFEDGQLLRPLAPGAPLPDSLLIDPYKEKKPFRVMAPLANGSVAIAVYNLTEPEIEVEGYISIDDYTFAGGMLQKNQYIWASPAAGLIIYDWKNQVAERLDSEITFPMKQFSDQFFIISPIIEGWAVIGRTDKYLSPAAVKVTHRSEYELSLRMLESGPLLIWNEDPIVSDDVHFEWTGNGVWKANVEVGQANLDIHIKRR